TKFPLRPGERQAMLFRSLSPRRRGSQADRRSTELPARKTLSTRSRRAPRRETPILRSRLVRPNLGAGLLARPRLFGALSEHAGRPLALVVADAGYGKTTLLA